MSEASKSHELCQIKGNRFFLYICRLMSSGRAPLHLQLESWKICKLILSGFQKSFIRELWKLSRRLELLQFADLKQGQGQQLPSIFASSQFIVCTHWGNKPQMLSHPAAFSREGRQCSSGHYLKDIKGLRPTFLGQWPLAEDLTASGTTFQKAMACRRAWSVLATPSEYC